ncbi:MAG: class I SAM-dependent methyltransferase [Longimicrobiales bacterium]
MSVELPNIEERARRFRDAYGRQRAAEGRSASPQELLALPYLEKGALARQWQVRARTFACFLDVVLQPRALQVAPRRMRVADLGAGNGWLCYRLALQGHDGLAVDIRTDNVDGLGAAAAYTEHLPVPFARLAASFESVPLAARSCDVAVFNAALHYALDLRVALAEAARIVVPRGKIVILDSPFYVDEVQGLAMVAEKQNHAAQQFGALAEDLMGLPFVEFLTPERLEHASAPLGLQWRRQRVRYPLWYEIRPLLAQLRRRRPPSRFDLWEAVVP